MSEGRVELHQAICECRRDRRTSLWKERRRNGNVVETISLGRTGWRLLKSLVKKDGNTGEETASYMDLSSLDGLATSVLRADMEARGVREREKHSRTDAAGCDSEAIIVGLFSV
jgi:hypothetical protein